MFEELLGKNKARVKAFNVFKKLGIPTTKNEDWKYTNLYQLKELELNGAVQISSAHALKNQGLSNYLNNLVVSPWKMVFVDGFFVKDLSTLPEESGLEILPLKEAAGKYPGQVNGFFKKSSPTKNFVQLNKALAFEGTYIQTAPGFSSLKDAIVCVYLNTQKDVAINLRNIISLAPTSKLSVVEIFKGFDSNYFNNVVTQVQLSEGSRLKYSKSQEEHSRSYHIHTLEADVEKDGNFESELYSIGAHLSRNEIEVRLNSPGAHCVLNGLFTATENQHVDNNTIIAHKADHCTSEQVYKGILDGNSHGVFSGKVIVHKNAQKTDAQQKNKNLLLSPNARIDTKPGLMIYADDVKCSHGATIGELDKHAIFYLQTRGIDEATAKQILTKAFANEMVEKIENEKTRVYFDKLLSSWFHQQVLH